MRNEKTTLIRALAGAAALSLLIGCSVDSGDPGSGAEATDSDDSSEGEEGGGWVTPDEVLANLELNRDLPTFTAPGPEIDPTVLEGKRIFLIPQTTNPFIDSIDEAMKEAADLVGVEVIRYPNEGEVSEWVQAMNTALTENVDLIFLQSSPDPRVLQPQLLEAEKAGIPVVVGHNYDETDSNPPDCEACDVGVTAIVPGPFTRAAEAAVDWIIDDSEGEAEVYVIWSSDVISGQATIDMIESRFAEFCDECSVELKNLPVADWNTEVQGEVQAKLNRDQGTTYVYPLYDAMVGGAVTAVRTVGLGDKVKVVSYNGSPYALKFIQDNDIAAMNVGEDTVGIGYANMDQAFRILLGEPTLDQRTPIRIWDSTNVDESGTPPAIGVGYGDETKNGYLELWGLN